jgi:hypothetical protein
VGFGLPPCFLSSLRILPAPGVDHVDESLTENNTTTGKRLLDIFTVHYYPQGGEFSDDVSSAMQLRRNRSTRSLWDPGYVDESWINDHIQLIRCVKNWVNTSYPGTQVGITEYNLGRGEPHQRRHSTG